MTASTRPAQPPATLTEGAERVFFCHLQKTGGTSLFHMLKKILGKRAVYPAGPDEPGVKAIIDTDHLVEHYRARSSEIRVVTGHFPLCTTELLGGDFAAITVLREPVERIESYLRHHRLKHNEHDRELTDIYDDPFRFHGLIHNHMVKMLSLTTDELEGGVLTRVDFTEEHLERAISNLARIDVVGRLDRYGEFINGLEARFGWDFDGEILHGNRTEPAVVSEGLRSRIVDDNALDLALWNHVVETWPR